ncbi:hypothetical protein VHUM_01766 [Vanrija humicola]|uniref:Uncharacterized protein n=1 Tax=Vanrija humicola TaxID=5417 RepID=A0A7D8Z016_VANHU|nr:hypothetical protein VHUM_01766 [Vanrija humicola]
MDLGVLPRPQGGQPRRQGAHPRGAGCFSSRVRPL